MIDNHSLVCGLLLPFACVALGCTTHQGCRGGCGEPDTRDPAHVVFVSDGDRRTRVQVEVVDRHDQRARGLMYRRRLEADSGMLFVYPVESNRTFWMKNTYIPLDMVFIGDNRRVVGVVEHAKPLSLERLGVDRPSRFVVEVNAGFARRHGIRPGTRVLFEHVEGLD